MPDENVIVELCRSNSIGVRFHETSIIEWRAVTQA